VNASSFKSLKIMPTKKEDSVRASVVVKL
jgi:hypothetical protein